MADRSCGLGGLFGDNSEILFFIILFLLLFWCPTGPCYNNVGPC